MKTLISLIAISAAILLTGCEQSPAKPAGAGKTPPPSADAHNPGDGHDHAGDKKPDAHSGESIELGSTKIGSIEVRASRDKGEIKAGGEAPIDAWLTGSDGK